jgi:hypothetical protein
MECKILRIDQTVVLLSSMGIGSRTPHTDKNLRMLQPLT